MGKLLGKKTIWAIHEAFEAKTFRVFPHFLYLQSFKFADKFIFPSKATYDYYKDFVPASKANIIYNGIDINCIEEYKSLNFPIDTRRELNIPDNHVIVCNVGTMDEIKGQIYLIKAAINLLNSSDNKNFAFIIVGDPNNEYSQNIKLLIEESGFKSHFRIIPVTNNVYKFLNITDIYVTSSFKETFCIANIEAMAFNKPVIATNVCGIPETIEHNNTGILISLTNMEKHIEENIKWLLENPKVMDKLAQNAYENVLNNFTFKKSLEKYEKTILS
ncbi:MAG: hypothetical protein A2104_03320 [Candidatus Melainabacteria bacterium GWF2_32_7]|nr:MAG: hypothetical protein A2104_03320 [Candidatus Melainabacteria bacterium GWF2_32_7]